MLMQEIKMRKVTEYELLRKAQHLAQHLKELCKECGSEDLAEQITAIASSMPAVLVGANNDTAAGYLTRIRRIIEDNENLSRLLLLARGKGLLSFDQWQRWSDELGLFGRMLTAMCKSTTCQPEPLSLTFTTELYLQ